MALNVTKLVPHAIVPTPGGAGFDIYASDGYLLLPGHRVVVSTGITIQLPPGTFGRLASRSGLAVKHGLSVGAEIIDPDYTGELKVVLFNHDTRNPFVIRPGYRIAQLIVMPLVSAIVCEPLPN
jgi:dUTP pyrophosphatase